ncbi:MAG TPA: TIM barrel protein, partial [Pirellulales bacterium]|nr:TIM barrel protein [Pirellulales bacterium]
MRRRDFLTTTGAVCAAAVMGRGAVGADAASAEPFHLKFAPHFGMFAASAGPDLVDQLKFAADHGFRAWEDNTMPTRSVSDQERVAAAMPKLGIEMGTISALGKFGYEVHFAGDDRDLREKVLAQITTTLETSKRVNAKWMTVVCGNLDPKLPLNYQTANAVDLLLRACDIVEPHGVTM